MIDAADCKWCDKPITFSVDLDDWTADDGTACGGRVRGDSNGDPVIGHHEPVPADVDVYVDGRFL